MTKPSLQKIDQIRQEGFRPEVVGCFVCDQKMLFVYYKKHNLWQLPQGGINNQETIMDLYTKHFSELDLSQICLAFGLLAKLNLICSKHSHH